MGEAEKDPTAAAEISIGTPQAEREADPVIQQLADSSHMVVASFIATVCRSQDFSVGSGLRHDIDRGRIRNRVTH